jgi:nucleoid-associated protein YgaU
VSLEAHNAPPPDSGDVPPHHLHHHAEHAAHSKLHSEWMDSFRHQKDAEFKTEADGSYAVQKGDTLETIARRALKHEHKDDPHYHASNKEVLEEEKRIRDANKGHDLDHHLKVGDRLKVPGAEKPAEAPHPPHPVESPVPHLRLAHRKLRHLAQAK